MHVRDLVALDRRSPCSGAARTREVADRLAAPLARRHGLDVGAHAAQHVDEPDAASGCSATSSITSSEPGVIARGDHEERGRRRIARHVELERLGRAGARRAPCRPSTVDRRAERGEHPLGVVAAAARATRPRSSPSACSPASTQRGLHLRARDRQARARMPCSAPPRIDERRARRRRRGRRSCAPIARSGSTTRAIGRGPQRRVAGRAPRGTAGPASTPESTRIVVPRVAAVEHGVGLAPARRRPCRRRSTASPPLAHRRRRAARARRARRVRRRRRSRGS